MGRSLLLLMALAVAGCDSAPSGNSAALSADPEAALTDADNVLKAAEASLNNSAVAPDSQKDDPAGWAYSERKDEMRGNVARFARLDATKPISLGFPYGESTPQLVLRQDPKYGFDIYITANGQFLCRSYDDDTISVKFDDGAIEQWACGDAEGGSSDIIFVINAERFLTKLKKAKRVIVEADMYEAGRQQMTFQVAGLKWGKSSESSGG